jgi:hypothetical protein
MPNQRSKNKSLIGAFVDTQLKARVVQFARSRNITASDVVGEALRAYLDGSGIRCHAGQPEPKPTQDPQSSDTEEIWLL